MSKPFSFALIIPALVSGSLTVQSNALAEVAKPARAIDWQSFLAKHDLLWERPGRNWYEGLFVGNGLLGSMIYTENRLGNEKAAPEGLRFDIGRADIYDRKGSSSRKTPVRVSIGRFVLLPKGEIRGGTGRLDLYNAEARGMLETTKGTIRWRCLIPSQGQVALAEAEAMGEEDVHFEARLDNPSGASIETSRKGGITVRTIRHKDGTEYSVASREMVQSSSHRWLLFSVGNDAGKRWVSLGDHRLRLNSKEEAIESLEAGWFRGPERLIDAHRRWWHAYYPASFISIPEQDMESYYWIQVYKLATALRENGPLADNLGPWSTDTAYPFHTWDLNVQLTYEAPFTINHSELVRPLIEFLERNMLHSAERLHEWISIPQSGSFEFPLHIRPEQSKQRQEYGGSAHLVWACYDYWLLYRHTKDDRLLLGGLFPLLKLSINGMIRPERLVRREDGKYELRYCRSPEYAPADMTIQQGVGLTNSNYELALLRWGLKTLLSLSEYLKVDDPDREHWKEILDRLPDYPRDETGYRISSEMRLDEGHRHFSHLMTIYPLHLVDGLEPAYRDRVSRSLTRWLTLPPDVKGRTAYTYSAASCMYSSLGQAEQAHHWLREFLSGTTLAQYPVVQPNTFYREYGPVFESPVHFVQSVSYMLLQSWRDRIQVFPAIPGAWKNVSFDNLRAQGAFLVSAAWENGRTRWVWIRSLAGMPCRIEPNLPSHAVKLKADPGVTMRPVGNGVFEISIKKGQAVLLYTDELPDVPAVPKGHGTNYYRIR